MGKKLYYYRGFLKACNYSCFYCPFAKHQAKDLEIAKDEQALARFVDWVEKQSEPMDIFFLPYGEGMIFPHFRKALGRVAGLPHIQNVWVQTNLSFSVEELLEVCSPEEIKKLGFWCTYHPSEVNESEFLDQVGRLQRSGIRFSVGAVANPEQMEQIKSLAEKLPEKIYFWLNQMEGLGRKDSLWEISEWIHLDPYFLNELKSQRADYDACSGGKTSFFVEASGDIYSCNRSKVKLGNLYEGEIKEESCRRKRCDCFLTYSNLERMKLASSKDGWEKFRYRSPYLANLYFYDIDGTLLDGKGKIIPEKLEILKEQLQAGKLFFNTTLSFEDARRKCREIWELFAGGIFAGGADIRLWEAGWEYDFPLELDRKELDGIRYYSICKEEKLLKVTLHRDQPSKEWLIDHWGNLQVVEDDRLIYLTQKGISKKSGMELVRRYYGALSKNCYGYGNSLQDQEWIRKNRRKVE